MVIEPDGEWVALPAPTSPTVVVKTTADVPASLTSSRSAIDVPPLKAVQLSPQLPVTFSSAVKLATPAAGAWLPVRAPDASDSADAVVWT